MIIASERWVNIRDCLLKKNPGNNISLYWQAEMIRIINYIEREVERWLLTQ